VLKAVIKESQYRNVLAAGLSIADETPEERRDV
jgi:hypothetical protein